MTDFGGTRRIFRACAALAAVTVAASSSGAAEFVLAERGRAPECAIVVPENAAPCVRYASEELQRFLREMTGVELPVFDEAAQPPPVKAVVLEVGLSDRQIVGLSARLSDADCRMSGAVAGEPPAPPEGADAFRLRVEDGRLRITGAGPRGVLYGVYEILEHFAGCRWYSSWHSVIPQLDRVAVPVGLDESHSPVFEMREPAWRDVRRHPEFEARLRVNGHKWGSIDEKFGGDDFRFGGDLHSSHTFKKLLPPEVYFDEHPEYYCMIDGKRTINGPRRKGWQPCLTNPDVLAIVTSNVLDRIRKDPGARFYGISQQDNLNYCECPECTAVYEEEDSRAGTVIRFVNAVAAAVAREFPDAVIETLAYEWSRKPPTKTRPAPNVVVCLCSIECDFAIPIAASRCRQSVAFRDDIAGWSRIVSGGLYVWDYTTDFWNYTIPWPNTRALRDNLRFFRDNGVRYVYSQGSFDASHGDFAELKPWLLAKLMWNPDQPLEPLLDDFFAGYYGAAAPFVREWFETTHRFQLERSASGEHRLWCYDPPENSSIPDDALNAAVETWRLAEEAVRENPALAFNVRMSKMSFDCLRLWRIVARHEGEAAAEWTAEDSATARSLARSLLERIREGNIRISEYKTRDAELKDKLRELAGFGKEGMQ